MSQRVNWAFYAFILLGATAALPSPFAVSWLDHDTRLTTYTDFDGISSLMQADDGKIWVAWTKCIGTEYSIYYKTSSDSGATWSNEKALTTSPEIDSSPSIYQTATGTVWLVWSSKRTGSYDLYYKTSSDRGATWSNDTRLTTDPADDLSPSIMETATGTVWVVWSSSRTGNYDLYCKTSSDGGATWTNDTGLTAHVGQDKLPSILQADDGRIWLVWCSDRTGDYEVLYQVYNGSAWSSETPLTSDRNVNTDPAVLQTFDHRIWVFWSSSAPTQTATNDIYYMYSVDDGASWSDPVPFTTDPYEDMWVAITQTRDLELWVTWTSDRADQPDYGNWDVYYKTSLVGDINGDGVVSIMDLAIVAVAYGSYEGHPDYNIDLDLNGDGLIDILDLAIIGRNYGGK
jgi:hypothetical protein